MMMKCRRLLLVCAHRATTTTSFAPPKQALRPCTLRLFSSSSNNNNNDSSSSEQAHEDYLKQVQELNEERQALFGFTQEEEEAWQHPKIHSSTLMDAVEQARKSSEKHLQEEHLTDYRQEEAIEQVSFPPRSRIVQGMTKHTTDKENDVFTHLDLENKGVNMVDVGNKQVTRRQAVAKTSVVFPPEVMAALEFSGEGDDIVGPKGPIFATAKLAGIMAAKRTSELIPLCHPLPLDKVHVDIVLEGSMAVITCDCRVTSKTGVEMEALTGATVAALTIYDMVKAVSHRVVIQETSLIKKTGGKRNVVVGKVEKDEE